MYPVIGVLPGAGAVQVIATSLVTEIAVAGAAGALGTVKAAPFPAEE